MTDRQERPADCLDAATLAEYLDGGNQPAVSRSDIEAHLARCEDCYELFAEAASLALELQASPAGPPVARPAHRRTAWRPLTFAGGALAAAAALWLTLAPPLVLQRWWDPARRPELGELVAAVGSRRAVEGRLTGGFAWATPPAPVRGAPAPGDLPEVQIAVARLAQRASTDRSASTLAALGTAYLAAGQIQRAVEALEESVALSDTVAFAWSDLAAAYVARSTLPGNAADVPRAVEAAERALALQPDLPEARFNRALALERLGPVQPALDAWQHYLAIDPESSWADEARTRLGELERRQARADDDAQALRERLFDEALPAWLSDAGGSPRDVPDAITAILEQLGTRSRDRMAADVVAAASRLAQAPGLAAGHTAYGRARAEYKRNAMDAAGPAFDEAATHLAAAGSPLTLSARLYHALVVYRTAPLAEAEHRLAELVAAVPSAYPSLSGRVKWAQGLVVTRGGDFVEAARLYQAALADFEEAGEPDNARFVRLLLAENAERRGEPLRAWEHRLAALANTEREGTLLQSAQSALRLNWPRTAAVLQDEAARLARAQDRLTTVVDALRLRAVTYASIGRSDEAARLVSEARTLLAGSSDSSSDRLRAEIDLAEAQAATVATAGAGIDAATRAAAHFSAAGGTGRLPEVWLVRGRLRHLAGERDAARDDLVASLEMLETQRDRLPLGAERLAFGEIARRAADELVEVEIAAGRPDAALAAADRVRGWDLARAGLPAGIDLPALRSAIGADTTILYYSVGATRTHLWTLRASGTGLHVVAASRGQLRRLVAALRDDRLDSSVMERLHELLIVPAIPAMAQGSRTIVVADGPLHALPFAALRGIESRYLAEEQALLFVPALGALSWGMGGRGSVMPRAVLAVGNPHLDERVFPDLPALPGAGEEARRVAGHYGERRLLIGGEATTDALVDALAGVDVLHFAGHAIVNDLLPEQSQLGLLGRDARPLTAAEISSLPLPHLSLAVLAACRSLGPVTDREQGPMNLARAFLQAGVGHVVANRWPVDDRAAVAFLTTFHERFARSGDAVGSLQHAQRTLLGGSDERLRAPSAWAGWVVIGAGHASSVQLSTRAHMEE